MYIWPNCFPMIILTWHLHNHDIWQDVLCMFKTTVIKCHSLSYDIFNANMILFEMSLLWHLDINKTTQPVINMTSRLIIKFKKPPSFIGQHHRSGGWFWHWLSWGHYNFLMTNSISTTVVEETKNIHDTVIMASSQPMSWQFNFI